MNDKPSPPPDQPSAVYGWQKGSDGRWYPPSLTVPDLMEYIPAPDYPTGGIILGTHGAKKAYREGRGSVVTRARHTVEEIRKKKEELLALLVI